VRVRSLPKFPLAEPQKPGYADKIVRTGGFALTKGRLSVCIAQPLGSQHRVMRNIITILLIVVARRAAGDG
jgi:hypothetical protein